MQKYYQEDQTDEIDAQANDAGADAETDKLLGIKKMYVLMFEGEFMQTRLMDEGEYEFEQEEANFASGGLGYWKLYEPDEMKNQADRIKELESRFEDVIANLEDLRKRPGDMMILGTALSIAKNYTKARV